LFSEDGQGTLPTTLAPWDPVDRQETRFHSIVDSMHRDPPAQ